jgi:hypothetical protein
MIRFLLNNERQQRKANKNLGKEHLDTERSSKENTFVTDKSSR